MKISNNIYSKFLQKLQKIISDTEIKITENINNEKVRMCWNIGKNIEEHLLQNNRGEYGKNLFLNLANDTNIAEKTLYQMRSFYKSYPSLPTNKNLNWSHYRNLISVKDDEQRQYLEALVIEEKLTSRDLQNKISQNKSGKSAIKKPQNVTLKVNRGKIFNYKIAEIKGEKFLDLGFNIFERLDPKLAAKFELGNLVESKVNAIDSEFSFAKSTATKSQLHTYKAYLERVVDGDTIRVELDLGFDIFHRQILRLSQINAPEKGTKEGEKAARKLKEILKNHQTLIIKTNKTDIYGRFVADVFLSDVNGEYLSQILVDEGLVEIY